MRLAVYEPDLAHNLGMIMRLSVCFNAPVDVIEPCGFPFSVKAVRKGGLDYADRVEVTHWASWRAFQEARLANPASGRLVLLTTKGAKPLWEHEFRENDILLLGRESAGVPDEVHNAVDSRLLIPMPGDGRSLNVVTACAIALGEANRQLTLAK